MAQISERSILPPLGQVIVQLILIATIALRPPSLPRLAITALTSYYCYTLLSQYTTGEGPMHDWGMGSNITAWGWAGILIFPWLCDPMREWRYKDEKATPADYPLHKKLWYAACVAGNARLIGWSSQVSNLPPPDPVKTRGQFLRRRILQALRLWLLVDITQAYIHLQPLFPLLGTDAFPGGWRGAIMRVPCYFAWYFPTYAMTNLLNVLMSIFCVATGLFNGNMEDWRQEFGNWSDAYTVRRFWGKSWHQNLRRCFTLLGEKLNDALGLQKGSTASSYVKLYASFALSGFIHSGGDLMMGARGYVGTSMVFFLANALAITFEDGVIAIGRRLGFDGPTKWTKRIGYAWVFAWFYIAAPLHVGVMARLPGVLAEELIPYSITRTYAPSFVIKAMQATL
ncbi:membrane bound O-acyl transferase family-domain-containing protein [Cubamyces lactineus]|nr:membrane bound O-acyl transferase family-domain-containing protein [Cubamyces lactineus]